MMMKKGILYGGALIGSTMLLLLAVFGGRQTTASTNYTFWARGDVIQIDDANKTIKVYSRHNSSSGEHDLAGQIVEFNVRDAKFYKYNNKLRKVRTTLGSLAVGDEVVLNGAKKNGDTYTVSRVTLNYHTVKIRGTVQGHNTSNRILTIELDKVLRVADKKVYRKDIFPAGTDVKVYYGSGTTIKNISGNSINADEIANNREKVTIENVVVRFGSRMEAGPDAKITDGKYTF